MRALGLPHLRSISIAVMLLAPSRALADPAAPPAPPEPPALPPTSPVTPVVVQASPSQRVVVQASPSAPVIVQAPNPQGTSSTYDPPGPLAWGPVPLKKGQHFAVDPVTDGVLIAGGAAISGTLSLILSTGEIKPSLPGSTSSLLSIDRLAVTQHVDPNAGSRGARAPPAQAY